MVRARNARLCHATIERAAVSWLERRYANPKVRGSQPSLDVFSWCKNQALNIRDSWCSAWFDRTPRNTVGSVSDNIWGGHQRTTGDAGIVTISVFRELDCDYSGN